MDREETEIQKQQVVRNATAFPGTHKIMTCKGICSRYKHTQKWGLPKYGAGIKRCSTCDVFLKTDDVRCICCNLILKTHSRNGHKKRPETEKQWFRIFKVLKENGEMTVPEISTQLNIPIPSIRRILSQFDAVGRLEKRFVYKIKEVPITSQ